LAVWCSIRAGPVWTAVAISARRPAHFAHIFFAAFWMRASSALASVSAVACMRPFRRPVGGGDSRCRLSGDWHPGWQRALFPKTFDGCAAVAEQGGHELARGPEQDATMMAKLRIFAPDLPMHAQAGLRRPTLPERNTLDSRSLPGLLRQPRGSHGLTLRCWFLVGAADVCWEGGAADGSWA